MKNEAITLVEVLIAVAIISIIGAVLYFSIAQTNAIQDGEYDGTFIEAIRSEGYKNIQILDRTTTYWCGDDDDNAWTILFSGNLEGQPSENRSLCFELDDSEYFIR